jgi:hypothetical protein
MKAAKVIRPPARIVTLSPAEWNRHRQRVIAKPAVEDPVVEDPVEAPKGSVEDVASLCFELFKFRREHDKVTRNLVEAEETVYRRLTAIFGTEGKRKGS